MLAICSQKIVSISYTAKLGPVQAQPILFADGAEYALRVSA